MPETQHVPLPESAPDQHAPDKYTVGIITVLQPECFAAWNILDESHAPPYILDDPYCYRTGTINGHYVVIARTGGPGPTYARDCAGQMKRSFPSIRFAFLVGIAGGVPSDAHDIRLGDVVISKPDHEYGGIVPYIGSQCNDGGHSRIQHVNAPSMPLLQVADKLAEDFERGDRTLWKYLSQMPRDYASKEGLSDRLYERDDLEVEITRTPRQSNRGPQVHQGLIGSGPWVIKTSRSKRDELMRVVGNPDILCFEMEAEGVMNSELRFLVVRGISDYADSHKNDAWQKYASATAACYVKWLLHSLPSGNQRSMQRRNSRNESRGTDVQHAQTQLRSESYTGASSPTTEPRTVSYISLPGWKSACGWRLSEWRPFPTMRSDYIRHYGESWMHLLLYSGAQGFFLSSLAAEHTKMPNTDKHAKTPISADLLPPNDAKIVAIQPVVLFIWAAFLGCNTVYVRDDGLLLSGPSEKLTLTDLDGFSLLGLYTQEASSWKERYESKYLVLNTTTCEGSFGYGKHSSLPALAGTSQPNTSVAATTLVQVLNDLNKRSNELDRNDEFYQMSTRSLFATALTLLTANSPGQVRIFPFAQSQVIESIRELSSLSTSWMMPGASAAQNGPNRIWDRRCIVLPTQEFHKLSFFIDKYDQTDLQRNSGDGAVLHAVLGFSWLAGRVAYSPSHHVLARPSWPIKHLDDQTPVLIRGLHSRCAKLANLRRDGWKIEDLSRCSDEPAFDYNCLSAQLQEVDWWLTQHCKLAARETLRLLRDMRHSQKPVSESGETSNHIELVRAMLIFRAVLFGCLLEAVLDSSALDGLNLTDKKVFMKYS